MFRPISVGTWNSVDFQTLISVQPVHVVTQVVLLLLGFLRKQWTLLSATLCLLQNASLFVLHCIDRA